MEQILKYFPNLTTEQMEQLGKLEKIYSDWNAKINLISRKDMAHFYERHVLHALSIYRWISFAPGSSIMDLGTGGGLPGIPLAILCSDVHFTLVDSIGKKIKAVQQISDCLGLKNTRSLHIRAEQMSGSFDFIVVRAVAKVDKIQSWCSGKLKTEHLHAVPNGLILLKGGMVLDELSSAGIIHAEVKRLSDYYQSEYYKEKYLIYLPGG